MVFILNLILPLFVNFSFLSTYSCVEYSNTHPVRNEIGLQIILKLNGYYDGQIDGDIGTKSDLAIKDFQTNNDISSDGLVGENTCKALLNIKPKVNKDSIKTESLNEEIDDTELHTVQKQLTDLGLYTGEIDGVNGSKTKKAIKDFQSRAGLVVDGILGNKTLSALSLGKNSYVPEEQRTSEVITITTTTIPNSNQSTSNNNSSSNSTSANISNPALDLINYNPQSVCTPGYVNNLGVWVPDPCFMPVFVYRFGKVAQVNSKEELDAYIADRWSLDEEPIYTAIGPVATQNYIDGIHSPVNGLIMPTNKSYPTVALGIKNDNNTNARPQSGPQNADAVFEVLVEGGMTRFINVFYQSDTSYHGPIRSARPTDPTVLRPFDGVLIASGATSGLIPEIKAMGVPVISDQRSGYFRISSHPSGNNRKAPHNLYADTNKLRNRAISSGYKPSNHPQPLFPWGDPSTSNWSNASYATFTFSSYTRTTWTWNGTKYLRTYFDAYRGGSSSRIHNTITQSGYLEQISTTTVIALFCEPYIHPLQLPSVKTTGSGRAIIMHNGKLLDAFWKRGANSDPFHIIDKNGKELLIPRGKVWVSLVPNTKSPSFG